jgi:hypothetical protein
MSFRSLRIKIFPVLGAYILLRHLLFAKHHGFSLGYRAFLTGSLVLLYFWRRMDRADERHLAEQEELTAQDPKHLFDLSTGLRTNPRERAGILLGLVVMGMGLLVQAIASGHIGMIFWGASCCLIAACIFVLT